MSPSGEEVDADDGRAKQRSVFAWQAVNLVGVGQMEAIGPECDIRMDFDTNEYPNIFVSRK